MKPMNERRKKMVRKIFKLMDKDNNGSLSVKDLKTVFNAKEHPMVIQGKMTEQEVLLQMLLSFNAGDDGIVSEDEWEEYQTELSSGIPEDE